MSLEQYKNRQSEQINQFSNTIADLQRQLNDLNQQLRIAKQVHQAQETASKEIDTWLAQGKKLFKDLCSIYPKEALGDLVEDIQTMAQEVTEEYENYAQSSRFLSGAEEEEEQPQPQASELPLIVETLPDEEDDVTPLSSSQVERVITGCDEPTLEFIKQQLGINRVKRLNAIAAKISELAITHKRLRDLLNAAELTASLRQPVPVLNGKS